MMRAQHSFHGNEVRGRHATVIDRPLNTPCPCPLPWTWRWNPSVTMWVMMIWWWWWWWCSTVLIIPTAATGGGYRCNNIATLENHSYVECVGSIPDETLLLDQALAATLYNVTIVIRDVGSMGSPATISKPVVMLGSSKDSITSLDAISTGAILSKLTVQIINSYLYLNSTPLLLFTAQSVQWLDVSLDFSDLRVVYIRWFMNESQWVGMTAALLYVTSMLTVVKLPREVIESNGSVFGPVSKNTAISIHNCHFETSIRNVMFSGNNTLELSIVSVAVASIPVVGDDAPPIYVNGTVQNMSITIQATSFSFMVVPRNTADHVVLPVENVRLVKVDAPGALLQGTVFTARWVTMNVSSSSSGKLAHFSVNSIHQSTIATSHVDLWVLSNVSAGNPAALIVEISTEGSLKSFNLSIVSSSVRSTMCAGRCCGHTFIPFLKSNISTAVVALASVTSTTCDDCLAIFNRSTVWTNFTDGTFDAGIFVDSASRGLPFPIFVSLIAGRALVAALNCGATPRIEHSEVRLNEVSVVLVGARSSLLRDDRFTFRSLAAFVVAVVTPLTVDHVDFAISETVVSITGIGSAAADVNISSPLWTSKLYAAAVMGSRVLDYDMQSFLLRSLPNWLSEPLKLKALSLLSFGSTSSQTSANYALNNSRVFVLLNSTNAAPSSTLTRWLVALVQFQWNASYLNISISSSAVVMSPTTINGPLLLDQQHDSSLLSSVSILAYNTTAGSIAQSPTKSVALVNVTLLLWWSVLAQPTTCDGSVALFDVNRSQIITYNDSTITLRENVFRGFRSIVGPFATGFGPSVLYVGCNTFCNSSSSSSSSPRDDCSVLSATSGRQRLLMVSNNDSSSTASAIVEATRQPQLAGISPEAASLLTSQHGLLSCASVGTDTAGLEAPIAVVAALAVAAGGGGAGDLQGLLTLSGGECSPASLKSQSSSAQVALSPFYALGERAMILGNVGLVVLCAVVQSLAVVTHMHLIGGMKLRAALTAARAPQWTHRTWMLLHIGITKAALMLLLSNNNGSNAVLGAFGLLFNGAGVCLVVHAHRTVVRHHSGSDSAVAAVNHSGDSGDDESRGKKRRRRRSDASREESSGSNSDSTAWYPTAAMFTKRWPRRLMAMAVPRAVRWLMPGTRWKPDWLRRQLGSLLSPVRGERRHWALYLVVVPTLLAVLGSLPLSGASLCPLTWGLSCVVTAVTAIAIAVWRPHRVSAMNGVQVVTYASLSLLCVLVAAGVTSAAVVGALSLLQSILSLSRGLLTLLVFVMEERMDAVLGGVTAATNAPQQQQPPATVIVPTARRRKSAAPILLRDSVWQPEILIITHSLAEIIRSICDAKSKAMSLNDEIVAPQLNIFP